MNKPLASFTFFLIFVFLFSTFALAASVNYPIISEVQIAGDSVTGEFVELYNPTANNVDLTGWKLAKKTATGNETNLVTDFPISAISGFGYFLISHPDFNKVTPNITYSTENSLAVNNTVLLYNNSGLLIDKLGFGSAGDKEGTASANPPANQSLERKATESSTLESMTTGADVFSGNGFDSNNNYDDFILRTLSEPQNSASSTEIPIDHRPTETPTPTPTLTPTLTPISTQAPTPTPSPTVIPTITITPIPTPTPTIVESPKMKIACFLKYYPYRLFFRTIYLPRVHCAIKPN